MKSKTNALARRYVVVLRQHLAQGAGASSRPALRLGRQAVNLRLETLGLARMHEGALAALQLANRNSCQTRRAAAFFSEAITPMVENHRATLQNKGALDRLNHALNRRTLDLASAHEQLRRGIIRRRTAEAVLKKSGEQYTRLLKESVQLQEGLRRLTHQVLMAQEEDRNWVSHGLQNEIAQTLLGLNVRLSSLKQQAQKNTQGLRKGIASTERLMIKSARSVRHTTRKFRDA